MTPSPTAFRREIRRRWPSPPGISATSPGLLGAVVGPLRAPLYAKWCVGRMATDAAESFAAPAMRTLKLPPFAPPGPGP
jgi:hypothetical protein